MEKIGNAVVRVCLAVAFSMLLTGSIMADQPREQGFNIPQQSVQSALNSLATQANMLLLFPYDPVTDMDANPVVGTYSIQRALDLLLRNTGLRGDLTGGGVIAISQAGTDASSTMDISKGKRMNINKRKSLLATLVGVVAAGGSGLLHAQDDGVSAGSQVVLEEVLVTAERRSASAQDVPISISAFSGKRLEESGVSDTFDLEMVTPGLSISSDIIQGNIVIRGVGAATLSGPGTDPSSSTYIDGVYQSQTMSAVVDLLDIERVEVLKGPQGTLYGRNSTSGAIKYISRKPGSEFSGSVKAEVGNYNKRKLLAIADIPLIEDKLLLRAALQKQDRDGYTEIINPSLVMAMAERME